MHYLIDKTNDIDDITKETNHLQSLMHKSLTNPVDTTKSLATHLMDALGGGVEADAWTYYGSNGFNIRFEWYEYGVKIPSWVISEMEWHLGNWGFGSALGVLLGHVSSKCGAYTVYCMSVALVLYVGYWSFTSYNKYICNYRGVRIWKPYSGNTYFWFSC